MRPLVLLALLALAACSEAPPEPAAPAAEADAALALLLAADRAPLDAAFERLEGLAYRLTSHFEQFDEDGRVVATYEETAEVAPGGARTLVRTDSSGALEAGDWGEPIANPVALLLPEEPPYLGPRGPATFIFSLEADTALGGRRVRVVTVEPRPGEGDGQALRHARLYLEAESGAVVGVRWRRTMESILFEEHSDFGVMLRPGPGGWLPQEARFETSVRAPLTAPRRFRLTRTYDGFEG